MSATVIASASNPIKFVEKNYNFSGEQIHFDRANTVDTVKDFQFTKYRVQKWKSGDPIRFQLLGFMVTDINLRIYRCNGVEITTANILPLNVLTDYQVGTFFYNVYQFEIDSSTLPIDTDFFIEVRYVGQNVPSLKKYISEPQRVVSEFKNSILYQYTNKYNDFNCIYAAANNPTWKQVFYFRVDGAILVNQPKVKKEVYDDQIMNQTVLDAVPYTEYVHKAGIFEGIADYEANILNYITSHTDVEVDGKKYGFGAEEWEKNAVDNYTLAEYSIKATEAIKNLGGYLGAIPDTTTCFVPSGLAINPSGNIATFNITGFNGYGFYYEIKEVFPGPIISSNIFASGIVYTNAITLSGLGLVSGNSYALYVKTICQGGQYSSGISDVFTY